MPSPVYVESYDAQTNQVIECSDDAATALFGSGELASAIDHAITQYQQGTSQEPFRALSVGCSYGPEVYTAASILGSRGIKGASLLGIDIDPKLIDLAKNGTYIHRREEDTMVSTLSDSYNYWRLRFFGFLTQKSTEDNAMFIGTSELRQDHDITFAVQNLIDEPGLPYEPDLVTCHNIFSQMVQPKKSLNADTLLGTIAMQLKSGSVLSIVTDEQAFKKDGYPEWHDLAAERLQDTFGMVALGHTIEGREAVFQKP